MRCISWISQHWNDREARGLQVPKVRKAFFPAFGLMCAAPASVRALTTLRVLEHACDFQTRSASCDQDVNIGVNTDVRAGAVMPRSKLWGAKRSIEMEAHAMSLIRDGYAVSTRRGCLGVLFSALLALTLFALAAATAQEAKQIKLTEKHIQGFIAASKDMAQLYDGADPDKPDPKVEAQARAVAKKNGFASLAQYDDVSMNITMIMSGIDPQTKKFTEPPEQIKNENHGAQGRQIRARGGKERGPDAARSGAQKRKAHSVQGKHRAGAKVLRPARAHHPRTRFGAATSGLETTMAFTITGRPH